MGAAGILLSPLSVINDGLVESSFAGINTGRSELTSSLENARKDGATYIYDMERYGHTYRGSKFTYIYKG